MQHHGAQKKKFDQALYDQNDTPARAILAKTFLLEYGLELYDNPDIYGPDMLAFKGNQFKGYVEFEVKHNWKGAICPFASLHFPMRKERILHYRPMIFVILNSSMSHLIWFKVEDLLEGRRIHKKTKLTDWDEGFIEVDQARGRWIATHD